MGYLCRLLALTVVMVSAEGGAAAGQSARVLHIKVALVDADLNVKPVPKYGLLVTVRPPVGEGRRIVTGLDGTVEISLAPGDYSVESDKVIEFQGKSYRWSRSVSIQAGSDAELELSVDNAVTESTTSRTAAAADLPSLFREWQDSVVTVWSDTGHGSGFLIDQKGLIATNQHVVGSSDIVQVQINATLKVPARVVIADPMKDIAILLIDPTVLDKVRPVRLGYAVDGKMPAVEGQQVFTIGSPLNQRKIMTSGIVSRIEQRAIISDVNINHGNSGGPLFTTDGQVIGITTFGDLPPGGGPGISGIVRIDEARAVIAEAERKSGSLEPLHAILLPVEPQRPFPLDAFKGSSPGS